MKIKVGVLFGGMSVEHEVSIISALQAIHALDRDKYEPVPIYIDKQGSWYTGEGLSDIENYKQLPELLKRSEQVILHTNQEGKHLLLNAESGLFRKKVIEEIHVAFPVTHGTYGEDGSLQGWLDLNKIPYVGCDVLSSAVGMDKIVMKTIVRGAGLPVIDYVWFYSKRWFDAQQECVDLVEQKLGYPVIVKPANLGSSVGIEKAGSRDELVEAIESASSFSPRIIVEKMVTNLKEVNCSVIGDYEHVEASECEEVLKSDEILSYQDKYMNQASKGMSGTSRIIPANIGEETTRQVQELAKQTFLELGCGGVSRIDFLIDQNTNNVYINEINTIPGSLSFYLWQPKGKDFNQLTDELVQLALKRSRERAQLTFSYDTNLLALQGKGGGKLGTKK